MKKLIDSFKAVDATGKTYIIDRYQEYSYETYLSSEPELVAGLESYSWQGTEVLSRGGDAFYICSINTEIKKVL